MAPIDTAKEDARWMAAALRLAERGLGRVAPNPAVGCILVRDGHAVGRGWTQPGGRPHAETEALSRAGAEARGATAYVTLEPCSHTGKTGPCADALIAAGISRAVIAMEDPDDRVSGRGIAMLEAAGIDLSVGILHEEAQHLNQGFVLNRTTGRPLVTLKLATSLDGRIATATGESKWITGDAARQDAHMLRMMHDAILVGIGTVLADDPALTCRLPGIHADGGVRVVLDSQGRLPTASKFCDGKMTSIQITATGCAAPPIRNVARIEIPPDAGEPGISVPEVLRALASRGITRVMVEGGGKVAASFLAAGMVDRIQWYRAGILLGADGVPCIAARTVDDLATVERFRFTGARTLGADRVDCLERVT